METKTNFLTTLYDDLSKIQNISCALSHWGNSFMATGNRTMGKKMTVMADDLYNTARNIRTAYSTHIQKEYERAQQASVNVLNAALAGAKLTKGDKYKIVFEECACSKDWVEHKEYTDSPILECCKCGRKTEAYDANDE